MYTCYKRRPTHSGLNNLTELQRLRTWLLLSPGPVERLTRLDSDTTQRFSSSNNNNNNNNRTDAFDSKKWRSQTNSVNFPSDPFGSGPSVWRSPTWGRVLSPHLILPGDALVDLVCLLVDFRSLWSWQSRWTIMHCVDAINLTYAQIVDLSFRVASLMCLPHMEAQFGRLWMGREGAGNDNRVFLSAVFP